MMKRAVRMQYPALAVALCLGLCGCAPRTPQAAARLETFAGIPPVAYLVERIGGDHVAVQVLVQPGQDPHTFEPSPQQMMALGRATMYFEVGMPFERTLLARIRQSRPDLTVVDTTKGIQKRMMVEHHHDEAAGQADGHEGHDGIHEEDADPHVWLSPQLLEVQARNIADALVAADADHAADYRKNLDALLKDVDATDARVRKVLAPYKGQSFYVFHPAFGYFADAYGLKQEAVEVEGKSPSPRQLAELIHKARAENVHIIFVQPQFASASADAAASSIDGAVVPMDALARDVLKNLDDMAAKIDAALNKRKTP